MSFAELLESIGSRKLDRLQAAISVIHKLRLSAELERELKVARSTVEGLQRLENLRDAILLLDATALAEIRRYTQPPPLVHDVVVAVLLLLGHDEGQTRVGQHFFVQRTTHSRLAASQESVALAEHLIHLVMGHLYSTLLR